MLDKKLRYVSITGVDGFTDLEALADLAQRYPFVELAMLVHQEKEGTLRNPDYHTRRRIIECLGRVVPLPAMALHLCGKSIFHSILTTQRLPTECHEVDRVQFNVNARREDFTDEQVLAIYEIAYAEKVKMILQYHEYTARVIDTFLKTPRDVNRIQFLMDYSRGKGVTSWGWNTPRELAGLFVGQAGGIRPENIVEMLAQRDPMQTAPYWFDLETGARDEENRFSIPAAEAILQAAAPYVIAALPASA